MSKLNISGDRVRKRRLELGLKQIEVSVALEEEHGVNISRTNVSEIENGKRWVKDYELRAIAAVLETSSDWLLENK